jgi:D-alanyl-lipoteichoic acid acyltransferase DltB (MBOAT superfamily)
VFQKISYLIDLKRGDRHIYGFLDFCMFVTFFPQLIAGPLVRHNEIIGQFALPPRRPEMWENLSRGFILFLIGVTKKVLFADTLAMVADPLFAQAATGTLQAVPAWIATVAYTLQIYFDFSGYSDMAIGLGLMFGLRLPFNFDAPYRATSARDFWRRWHMTLSRFLRDYLYIPLGGNRRGAVRQAFNVIATMLLGGLWHGANWTFVAWGGLWGAALAVNHFWAGAGLRLPRAVAWALTLLFAMGCWVLFRAPDFASAGRVLGALAFRHGSGGITLDRAYVAALVGGAAVVLLGPTSQVAALTRLRPDPRVAIPAGVLLAYLLLLVGGRLPNVFIYFQF